jgi:septal ring factor EnvC (AmiA/AmiB activator)
LCGGFCKTANLTNAGSHLPGTQQYLIDIRLVALLRFLDQDYDESCEKATRPLESFSDDDLAYLIHVRLRAMQGNASIKKMPDKAIQLKHSLKELSQKHADLEQTLLATQDLNKKLLAEKSALEAHLSALRQVQKDYPQAVQCLGPLLMGLRVKHFKYHAPQRHLHALIQADYSPLQILNRNA